jgi:hypothetical protein
LGTLFITHMSEEHGYMCSFALTGIPVLDLHQRCGLIATARAIFVLLDLARDKAQSLFRRWPFFYFEFITRALCKGVWTFFLALWASSYFATASYGKLPPSLHRLVDSCRQWWLGTGMDGADVVMLVLLPAWFITGVVAHWIVSNKVLDWQPSVTAQLMWCIWGMLCLFSVPLVNSEKDEKMKKAKVGDAGSGTGPGPQDGVAPEDSDEGKSPGKASQQGRSPRNQGKKPKGKKKKKGGTTF